MINNYILKNRVPHEEPNLLKWGKWMQENDRTIAKTKKGNIIISTVFLGVDYNFAESGPPVLFETMVFGGKHDGLMHRYTTWDEAMKGHLETQHLALGTSYLDA